MSLSDRLWQHRPDLSPVYGVIKMLLDTGRLRPISPVAIARFVRDLVVFGQRGPQSLIHLHALDEPERPALVDGALRLSYGELDGRVNRVAHGLSRLGVGPGDRVALLLHNGSAHVEVSAAVARVAAVSVHVGSRLKAAEVAFLLRDSGARALVFDARSAATVEEAILAAGLPRAQCVSAGGQVQGFPAYEHMLDAGDPGAPPRVHGSDGGMMIYTSGTTGKSKGARRKFAGMGYGPIINLLAELPMVANERHLVVCPLYHSSGAFFASVIFALGGCVILDDKFEPAEILRQIEHERITSAMMVPTMLNRLVALGPEALRKHDLSSLRWLMSGAAPLPTALAGAVEESFGPILYNFYGATETGIVTLACPGEHTARPGTIGKVVRGSEIRLVGDGGAEVPVGEVGELYVRNKMLIDGYHGNATATNDAQRDGFFSVGDLARRDAEGYYYLADRKHDMVISGGVNIYPMEIEQRLHAHPSVSEAAVIGVPDPDWGESLCAFVVLRAGRSATTDELQAFVTAALADYKKPRKVLFLDALPRNPTGKVLKRELREQVAAAPAAKQQ